MRALPYLSHSNRLVYVHKTRPYVAGDIVPQQCRLEVPLDFIKCCLYRYPLSLFFILLMSVHRFSTACVPCHNTAGAAAALLLVRSDKSFPTVPIFVLLSPRDAGFSCVPGDSALVYILLALSLFAHHNTSCIAITLIPLLFNP